MRLPAFYVILALALSGCVRSETVEGATPKGSNVTLMFMAQTPEGCRIYGVFGGGSILSSVAVCPRGYEAQVQPGV